MQSLKDFLENSEEQLEEAVAKESTTVVGTYGSMRFVEKTTAPKKKPGKPPQPRKTYYCVEVNGKEVADFGTDKAKCLKVIKACGVNPSIR